MPKRSELKITKRAVDALSVEAGDALFWDRGLAGFGVQAHAPGITVQRVAASISTGTLPSSRAATTSAPWIRSTRSSR